MLKRLPKRPRLARAAVRVRPVAPWLAVTLAFELFGCPNHDLAPLDPCTVSGVSKDVPVGGVDKVDLLFVVDNSGSMAEEQEKLAQRLTDLVRILTVGELPNGKTFPPWPICTWASSPRTWARAASRSARAAATTKPSTIAQASKSA